MKAHIKNVILGVSTLAFLHSNFATAATTAPATLAVGDSIVTNRPTRVWVTPPTAGELAGLQTPNAKGCIVDGPARTFDAVWWKVDFITQNDGWVMERDLRKDGVMKPNVKPRPAPPISDHVLTISPFTPASGSVVSSPQIIVQGRIAHDVYAPSMISATLNGKAISLNESGGFAVKMNLIPGKNDLRVPPDQGRELYHHLKSQGKEVYMNIYEDCHPLAKIPVHSDVLVNAALFFESVLTFGCQ